MSAEEDVQSFLEEIQDLTRYMKDLNRTVATLDSAIIEKFGVAVKKNTESVKDTTKLLDQFGREIKEVTQETKGAVKAQKDAAAEARRGAESTRRTINDNMRQRSTANELFREFGQGVDATRLMRQQIENLGGESIAATAGFKAITAGLEGLFKSTTLFASALYKGERGAAVSAKALTALVSPLTELAISVGTLVTVLSIFGPAGMIGRGLKLFGLALGALGLATKAGTKYNELAAEQTDKLFKSFNDLSKSGVNLTGGFGQVFEMAQTLGLSVAELEEFNKLLTSNTQTLSLFGGTAAKGAEQFADAAGMLVKEFGRELELMGIDRAEQREIAMGYMNIQARTGQLMNKNVNQLAAESAKYIKELDMLAELTGTSRKEQQAAMEANLAESRYRAALFMAEKQYGKESAEFKALERAGEIAAGLRTAGLKDLATGTLQMAAGRGAVTTPEAIKAQAAGIGEIIRDSNLTTTQAMTRVGENLEKQSMTFGRINTLIGETVLQERIPAVLDFDARMKALKKAAEEAGQTPEEFLKTEAGKRILAGKETQAVVDAGRTQQNAALMMDSAVRSFNGAAQISLQASTMFANAVKAMPGVKITGGGYGAGGKAGGGAPAAGGAVGPGAAAIGDLASKIVKAEGGAVSARNPYSSASGLGQITKGRYQDLVKEAKVGSKLYGTTFEQYQKDAGIQQEALNAQIENLRSYLASKGLSTTDAAVYMAHVFGPGGARQVLTHADNVPVNSLFGQNIIDSNPAIFRGVSTVGELKKVISDKMGGTGYRFGGIASGPSSGYIAQLHGTEAVIPMNNGQSIKVDMPDFSTGIGQQMQAMTAQITRLDELVTLMRRQAQVSEKILQVSQN